MFHDLLTRAIALNSEPQPLSFLKSSSFASSMDQSLACLALSYRCDPPPTKQTPAPPTPGPDWQTLCYHSPIQDWHSSSLYLQSFGVYS